MAITRKILAARNRQLSAQLSSEGNPGRIKLRAQLKEALEALKKLSYAFDNSQAALMTSNVANNSLIAELATVKSDLNNALIANESLSNK